MKPWQRKISCMDNQDLCFTADGAQLGDEGLGGSQGVLEGWDSFHSAALESSKDGGAQSEETVLERSSLAKDRSGQWS